MKTWQKWHSAYNTSKKHHFQAFEISQVDETATEKNVMLKLIIGKNK